MPTYEYKCKRCGHAFEKFQPITSAPVRKCPECGKNAVERLISAGGGLIFKGSGFYITDYRDAAYNDKAKADAGSEKAESKPESGDSKPAAATADAKAETKSEAKAESKTPAKSETQSESKAPAKSETKTASKSAAKKKS